MNNIHVTVELCAEDRARLDAILAAMTKGYTVLGTVEEATETAQELTKAKGYEVIAPEPEEPTEATTVEAEAPAAEEPTVKREDIRRKVVELSTAGKKAKAEVRTVIQAYAPKVSAIPEDKLTEIWTKLSAM